MILVEHVALSLWSNGGNSYATTSVSWHGRNLHSTYPHTSHHKGTEHSNPTRLKLMGRAPGEMDVQKCHT